MPFHRFVLFVLVNFQEGIQREYGDPVKRCTFVTINCLFCEKKFIYEETFLCHLNYVHFKQSTVVPRERPTVSYS